MRRVCLLLKTRDNSCAQSLFIGIDVEGLLHPSINYITHKAIELVSVEFLAEDSKNARKYFIELKKTGSLTTEKVNPHSKSLGGTTRTFTVAIRYSLIPRIPDAYRLYLIVKVTNQR